MFRDLFVLCSQEARGHQVKFESTNGLQGCEGLASLTRSLIFVVSDTLAILLSIRHC